MMGDLDYGVDLARMKKFAEELKEINQLGVKMLVEVGGGNIYRWRQAVKGSVRNTADMMGMLGSVMTALNLADVLKEVGVSVCALSSLYMPQVIPFYTPKVAKDSLEEGKIVVVGGGAGEQFFTTDTGVALHGLQTGAEVVLKGTDVEGVYSADPNTEKKAELFSQITFDEVLEKKLAVMDMSAFALLREAKIPLMVFNVQKAGNLLKAVSGEKVGTLVTN